MNDFSSSFFLMLKINLREKEIRGLSISLSKTCDMSIQMLKAILRLHLKATVKHTYLNKKLDANLLPEELCLLEWIPTLRKETNWLTEHVSPFAAQINQNILNLHSQRRKCAECIL